MKTPTRASEKIIALVGVIVQKRMYWNQIISEYLLAIHQQDFLCVCLVGENTNKGCGNLIRSATSSRYNSLLGLTILASDDAEKKELVWW